MAVKFPFQDVKVPRVLQHVLFWVLVSVLMTGMYAVQSDYMLSLRNNLLYMPVQIAYYYAITYWLIPRYLFVGRYVMFGLLFLPLIVITVLVSRCIGVLYVIPYVIANRNVTDVDYLQAHHRPFLTQLFDLQSLVNALKGTNFVIGFVVAIKLFKMWHERKQAALEAELAALKAQVHPHFLFNTLNNLYALSLNQSPKSPQLILGLSDLLRYMLYECNADDVPLQKEVFMMQQYVKLEKLRYEERIDISFNITGDLEGKQIAPLMILPFVENAFKHGASETTGQAWVNIDINVRDNQFKLKVANNNPTEKPASKGEAGHIGLKNVSKRLDLIYPNASHLKVMDDEGTFLVVLNLELHSLREPLKQTQHQPVNPQLATV